MIRPFSIIAVVLLAGCGNPAPAPAPTAPPAKSADPAPAASGPGQTSKLEEEQKKFQGVWQFSGFEQGGIKIAPEKFADAKWVFEGSKTTFMLGTTVQESTLTIDASKEPRHIDLMVTAGPDKGSVYRGIYKFLDGELILCFPGDTKAERPREFSGNAGPRRCCTSSRRKQLDRRRDRTGHPRPGRHTRSLRR